MKKKNRYPRIRDNRSYNPSLRSMLLEIMSKRSFHIILLSLLFIYYSVVYYFGEIVDLAGWESLRWEFFYGVHDIPYSRHIYRLCLPHQVGAGRYVYRFPGLSPSCPFYLTVFRSPYQDCFVHAAFRHRWNFDRAVQERIRTSLFSGKNCKNRER